MDVPPPLVDRLQRPPPSPQKRRYIPPTNFHEGRGIGLRKLWTRQEEFELIKGTMECGIGNWKEILQKYQFPSWRTNVHLKDKYRTLEKKGLLKQMVEEIELELDG